jgi:hypothetical protein
MNERTWNALLIGGSTLAGGVLGTWASTRASVTLGCRFGPWGAVTGAVLGALIGSLLSRGPRASGETDLDTV